MRDPLPQPLAFVTTPGVVCDAESGVCEVPAASEEES